MYILNTYNMYNNNRYEFVVFEIKKVYLHYKHEDSMYLEMFCQTLPTFIY